MASNPEHGLVTAIIDSGDVGPFIGRIKAQWLFDRKAKQAWSVVRSHYEQYRESITREMLHERFPLFEFQDGYGDSVDALIDIVSSKWLANKILVTGEDAAQALAGSHEFAQEDVNAILSQQIARLQALQRTIETETDTNIAISAMDAVDRYRYRRDNKGVLGLPFPWGPMQRETFGAQNGNFILFWGRQKSMKTWILLWLLKHWHYYFRRKILLVVREMTKEQIQDRNVALWAALDYKRFRGGELSPGEELLLEEAAEAMTEASGYYVEYVDGYGSAAVSEIAALIDRYDLQTGDVLAVDGMYFFAQDQEWQSFKTFSQGLKRVALNKDRQLVVVATSQGNRDFSADLYADSGKEMGLGDAPLQDCDAAVKLALDPEEKLLRMMLTTLREGEPCQWACNAKPCTDFSVKYSDAPDLDNALQLPKPEKKGKAGTKEPKTNGKAHKKATSMAAPIIAMKIDERRKAIKGKRKRAMQ